ncbi:hypothetical protein B0H63DRAFT_488313 [Podospora didyma]|uniref:enoyl-[acyl-carrier-protein] reductase n=1 Tax=Podospora didyma TaxID=330526 RepID=A0AAE0K1I5_9PEZI|nr:hypothetical protein B0H63DRAFT_488313 [Podospora didyma]
MASNSALASTGFIVTLSTTTGSGIKVHTFDPSTLASPRGGEALVKFHGSSINPLDLAVISGTYAVKPKFAHNDEFIVGFDGLGQVLAVGPDVKSLKVDDFVIPAQYGIGTWRSHALLAETLLDKIPRPAHWGPASALRLGVAPAYLLVENFRKLTPGDWIIQNAGTSFIAQMVEEFARLKGAKVISVVRDRQEPPEEPVVDLASSLPKKQHALKVNKDALAEAKDGKRIVMAIDSVGGYAGQQLLDSLTPGGTFVQHGFLAGTDQILPLTIANSWARNLSIQASRSSAHINSLTVQERRDLMTWFAELLSWDHHQLPKVQQLEVGAVDQESVQALVEAAVSRARKSKYRQRKQVLVWDPAGWEA